MMVAVVGMSVMGRAMAGMAVVVIVGVFVARMDVS
jgi:hypothetical protein